MAYRRRISDWSSDVCSSDLSPHACRQYLMLDPSLSLGGASSPPWGREVTRRIRHKRLMHEMIYDLSEDQVQFRDVIETFLRKSYGDDARRDKIGRAHVNSSH